jgi:hypothetical protein
MKKLEIPYAEIMRVAVQKEIVRSGEARYCCKYYLLSEHRETSFSDLFQPVRLKSDAFSPIRLRTSACTFENPSGTVWSTAQF